ncbi:hypothetical protein EVAR_37408_1 [Eumeta japonica]|uniref:Uncharacterized protein n=1 Tax=Eumeta variegata TaxID=151549 RepID=A0A4C1WE12_EUMVA|nr:hypothetical protein EVAR_37408_1 [Eumeta japonica]
MNTIRQKRNTSEKAQAKIWKEFCTAQERDTTWEKINWVIGKTTRRNEEVILRNENEATIFLFQSAELLAHTFYSDDIVKSNRLCPIGSNYKIEESSLAREDPLLTTVELPSVLREQNPKKAPGPDALTAAICRATIQSTEGIFENLSDPECL